MNWRRGFTRLMGKAAGSPRPHTASGCVYSKNAPGDFYVEDGCCTLCGVPWDMAPDHFEVDDQQCYVKRQPTNEGEVHKMISVMEVSEFDCIRYKGRDRQIIDTIRAKVGDQFIDDQSS